MKYRFSTARSISWWRVSAAGATVVLAMSWASGASADVKANQKCRTGVGSQLSSVAKKGMISQEKCYSLAAKVGVTGAICTDPATFPFVIIDGAAYQKAQDKAEINLITKTPGSPFCPGATTADTLDNYANNDTGSTYDNLTKVLQLSADYVIGTADLNGDKTLANCQKTVAVARRNIATTMLAEAVKCQKAKDKVKTLDSQFVGGLDRILPDCLNETTAVTNKIASESTKITAKCGAVSGYPDGTAVGACSPLPTCVADSARATGRNLALAFYPSQTCDATSPTANGRTVTVSLSAPAGISLGGADVRVSYPNHQAGVPGNGSENSVLDAITDTPSGTFFNASDKDGVLDVSLAFGGTPFTGAGTAFSVKMDKCEDLTGGTCSVTTTQACAQSKDCSAHCLEQAEGGTAGNTNTSCTQDSDCPLTGALPGQIQQCVCPTCQSKRCVGPNTDVTLNATCHINTDCGGTGGGFCVASEQCIPQTDHCSVSQYLGCGKPTDDACPAGEDCVTQSALTTCSVLNAFDDTANELDGVTCSVNVTEP